VASVALRLLGALPLPLLRAGGALLGIVVMLCSGGYRRKLLANLRRAGLGGPVWALRAAAGAGQTVLELPWVWSRPPAQLAARVRVPAGFPADGFGGAGRGVLFLTPHLGAFDVAARWYAMRWPVTVMYREPTKAWLRPLAREVRTVPGMSAVPATSAGVRSLLRGLRAGEAVALLPDHVPGEGEGQWASFFGEPAWTMVLPQRLAQATGAQPVMVVCERVAGGWLLRAQAFAGVPDPQTLNTRMESLIRELPQQYLWGYNRYKRPRGVPSPADARDVREA
jgi:Kdo2-lipid IVA lauroyltransferase/acyltransferase